MYEQGLRTVFFTALLHCCSSIIGHAFRSQDEEESEESEDEEIKRTRSRRKTSATAEKVIVNRKFIDAICGLFGCP